jgi:RAC serine/threonine-protein kinase
VIGLKDATTIGPSLDRKKKTNMFEVHTPKRVYFLSAQTAKDRDDWIAECIAVRDRVQGKTKAEPAAEPAAKESTAQTEPKKSLSERVGIDDFELMKVVGKGSFGKVLQVRKRDTGKIYAMKVLNKKTILERNEVEHTKAEKSILQKLVHPFLVNLNYSFQTPDKLYFIMDYVNGGELFFHLQKDKKFDEDRVRFYCAEIVCGLEYLHVSGVLYRYVVCMLCSSSSFVVYTRVVAACVVLLFLLVYAWELSFVSM